MRLERRHALKEVRRREQQVVDTLRLTSEICTQRHHEGLFRKLKETLPGFFGFQAVGVLMHNKAENFFFSDPDSGPDNKKKDDDGDGEDTSSVKQGEGEEKKKKTSAPETVMPIKEKPLTEEEKAEKIRAIHKKRFMNYPTNSGISGMVFKSKELYYSNNATKESKFVEEIDDQTQSGQAVKNFMIGPVFGAQDPSTPCAII